MNLLKITFSKNYEPIPQNIIESYSQLKVSVYSEVEVYAPMHINMTLDLTGLSEVYRVALPFCLKVILALRTNQALENEFMQNVVTIPFILYSEHRGPAIVRNMVEDLQEYELKIIYEDIDLTQAVAPSLVVATAPIQGTFAAPTLERIASVTSNRSGSTTPRTWERRSRSGSCLSPLPVTFSNATSPRTSDLGRDIRDITAAVNMLTLDTSAVAGDQSPRLPEFTNKRYNPNENKPTPDI